MSLAQSITRAKGGTWDGRQGLVPGPGHSSRDRSMAIMDNDAGDDVICHSFAGDDPLAFKAALRKDGFLPTSGKSGFTVVAPVCYVYRDSGGSPLFRITRRPDKRFIASTPDGQGGWRAGMNGIKPIPYRLPELLACDLGSPIFVTEGEKDADSLARLGLVATTNPFGAGKWPSDFAPYFADRTVHILPDNDEPGRKHAAGVARNLSKVAKVVTITELPGLPDKGDVSDWIAAGGTAEELVKVTSVPFSPVQPVSETQPKPISAGGLKIIDVGDWHGAPVPKREWRVPGWILPKAVTLLNGAGSTGKSLLLQQWMSFIGLGDQFLGLPGTEAVPTLYVNCEDDEEELHRRQVDIAKAAGRPLSDYRGKVHVIGRIGCDNPLGIVNAEGVFVQSEFYLQIRATALELGVKVLALDNAMQLFVGNLNDPREVTVFCNALARLAIDIDGAVVLAGHVAKSEGSQFAGTMAWENAVRTRLFFQRETDSHGEEIDESDRRYLTRGKINYGRKGGRLEMVWHNGAFYSETLDGAGQDSADSRYEACFLRCLDDATAQRRSALDKPSAAYAPKLFAVMKAAGGSKQRELEKAMQRLFDRGEIVANSLLWRDDKQRRNVFGIARYACANPCANRKDAPAQTTLEPCVNLAQTRAETLLHTKCYGAGPDAPPFLETREAAE